ncbi:MAG TPA: hypothetical protein VLE53_12045 [Gemmatimonadaceae bacterium]|nr:hypothetical protein [Gemmatimonadaceae bacterium]
MRRASLVVVSAVLLASCRGQEIVSGVSDSTFARTMIALRRLPLATGGDTTARTAARDSILRAHGVTAAQLESAAVRLASQPDRAANLWRVIEAAQLAPK